MITIERITDSSTHSALSIGSYSDSLHELTENSFTPVSVETLAETRIKMGIYHQVSWTGSRTTDFFAYKDDQYYLAHANLNTPKEKALIHSLQEFNKRQTELPYLEDLLQDTISIPREDLAISVENMDNNPIAEFLLKDQLKPYQRWLQEVQIPYLPIMLPAYSLVRKQRAFIRPLIMRCTDNWSGIITANADLHNDYGFRGLSESWKGQTTAPETFSREHLEVIHKLVPLENRDYLLTDLQNTIVAAGYGSLLNNLLRLARNSGRHGLPANYDTFS